MAGVVPGWASVALFERADGADAAVAFYEVGLGGVVAVDDDDEILTLGSLSRSHDFCDEGGMVDLAGGIFISGTRK